MEINGKFELLVKHYLELQQKIDTMEFEKSQVLIEISYCLNKKMGVKENGGAVQKVQ